MSAGGDAGANRSRHSRGRAALIAWTTRTVSSTSPGGVPSATRTVGGIAAKRRTRPSGMSTSSVPSSPFGPRREGRVRLEIRNHLGPRLCRRGPFHGIRRYRRDGRRAQADRPERRRPPLHATYRRGPRWKPGAHGGGDCSGRSGEPETSELLRSAHAVSMATKPMAAHVGKEFTASLLSVKFRCEDLRLRRNWSCGWTHPVAIFPRWLRWYGDLC